MTKFIEFDQVNELNRVAIKHKQNALTDDCPILSEGNNVPILLALPGIAQSDLDRCMLPAGVDSEDKVFLDVRREEYEKLPQRKLDFKGVYPSQQKEDMK